MIHHLNPLKSVEDMNRFLSDLNARGQRITRIRGSYFFTQKSAETKRVYANISFEEPNNDALFVKAFGAAYLSYEHTEKVQDINALYAYYEALNVSYKRTTLIYAMILFPTLFMTFSAPILPQDISGWLVIVFSIITVIRSVNQQRFTKKLYIPFLKAHHFSDGKLQNHFIVRAPVKLKPDLIAAFNQFGALNYLKELDGLEHYEIYSYEPRATLLKVLTKEDQKTIEVLSTVRK